MGLSAQASVAGLHHPLPQERKANPGNKSKRSPDFPGRNGRRFPAVIPHLGRSSRGVGNTLSHRLPKIDGIPACPVG